MVTKVDVGIAIALVLLVTVPWLLSSKRNRHRGGDSGSTATWTPGEGGSYSHHHDHGSDHGGFDGGHGGGDGGGGSH
jgi:hypothetical protein